MYCVRAFVIFVYYFIVLMVTAWRRSTLSFLACTLYKVSGINLKNALYIIEQYDYTHNASLFVLYYTFKKIPLVTTKCSGILIKDTPELLHLVYNNGH